ncbi:MAG: hypothetical protein ACLQPD_31210 [Desulfomonilaceae bacterium]
MKYELDLNKPLISSRVLAKMLGISVRMVSHLVYITGQEASEPADGPGTRRKFTTREAASIVLGQRLGSTGMPPGRIRQCIAKVMDGWEQIFPGPIIVEGTSEIPVGCSDWSESGGLVLLFAWEAEDGFHCDLVDGENLEPKVVELQRYGLVVINVADMLSGFLFVTCLELDGMPRGKLSV